MKQYPNRYADAAGPPRALRNLDDWTQDGGRADRDLDAAMQAHETANKARRAAIPDVYEVADRVLAPILGDKMTCTPRRLRQDIEERLAARGIAHPTRQQRLAEARLICAGDRAAGNIEVSLALTLAAALLWEPQGGWKAHAPRGPRREGFSSVRHLLAAAFGDVSLGVGPLGLEVAQNRARTRSLDGEVFVQATHTGTARARNAAALDRQLDAQAIVYRSTVDLALVPLLFERSVLGRYPDRASLLDELRLRRARAERKKLPQRPPKGASDTEMAAWRLASGVALWGEAPEQEAHVKRHDAAMLHAVRDAERALRAAVDLKERGARPSRVAEAGYADA